MLDLMMRTVSLLTISLIFSIQIAYGQLREKQVIVKTVDGLGIQVRQISNGNDVALIYCHRLLSSMDSFDLDSFGDVFLERFDILKFDFRGHRRSGGFSTCGGDEVLDLLAVAQYARQGGYRRIAVLGVGMGGTVAIRQAALFGNVDAIVAVSPLGRPKRFRPWSWGMASRISAKVDYVKIPVRLFNGTRIGSHYLTGLPINLVDRISPIPFLIIHGDDGEYLNFKKTQELYENAKEPKKLLIIPRREYSDGMLNERSAEAIVDWLKSVLPNNSPEEAYSSRELPIPIKEIEVHGDVVLPEQMIKEAIEDTNAEASVLNEQIDQIEAETELLHKYKGYTLSRVSDIQLSDDGHLLLEMEVDRIHRLAVEGNRQATSERIWQELQTEEGDYYNAWELEKAMKRLSRLSIIADFENQLFMADGSNMLRILIKEQRQWSVAPTIKINSFDYFGGLSFSLNRYRPDGLRIFGSSLVGIEHRNWLYRLAVERSWLQRRKLSTRLDYEQFINRRGILDYYFARQEARERGGGLGVSYGITDNTSIHAGVTRKKFAAVGGDDALPVAPGNINTLTLLLKMEEQILQTGNLGFKWHSQTFLEKATTLVNGDYDYTVFQLNFYPQLTLTPTQTLNMGLHWGTSWNGPPPQKLFSIGGIKTMPGYGYDAFVGEHVFLLRAKYGVNFGKWLGGTSRWEPLALSFLLDAGDARMKNEPLKFGSPQLESGVELSYATVIKIGLVKSIGPRRTDPYVYFGWYPNLILSGL